VQSTLPTSILDPAKYVPCGRPSGSDFQADVMSKVESLVQCKHNQATLNAQSTSFKLGSDAWLSSRVGKIAGTAARSILRREGLGTWSLCDVLSRAGYPTLLLRLLPKCSFCLAPLNRSPITAAVSWGAMCLVVRQG
jgi:hypothetical protein